jgi:hypothetical protein
MKVHKWAKEINAWANGAEIEKWMLNDTWQTELRPDWNEHSLYRIKQQLKEPQYVYVYRTDKGIELGLAPYPAMNMYNTTIMGKIKLENV